MKKSWFVVVAAIALVAIGSIAIWETSGSDGRRIGAVPTASELTRVTSPTIVTPAGENYTFARAFCPSSHPRVVGGGISTNFRPGTDLIQSYPDSTVSWAASIRNTTGWPSAVNITWHVHAICIAG